MIDNPLAMMKGLVALAPDFNLRVALIRLIDFLDRGPNGTPPSTLEVLDVISQTLVSLHHHVDDDTPNCPFDIHSPKGDNVSQDDIDEFKRILGLMPEADEEGK
jgi:hypothetical protein